MNTMLTKEQEINSYMSLLGISKREAEKLWEDDHSEEVLPEVKEMEKKAKQIKRYEKSDKKRKNTPKERKIDTEKLEFLKIIKTALADAGIQTTQHNERELTFKYDSTDFTVRLIRHRKPKTGE